MISPATELHRVALARPVGEAGAALVEVDHREVLGHRVADEAEVGVGEEHAGDLQQVLARALQLVPDPAAVEVGERHRAREDATGLLPVHGGVHVEGRVRTLCAAPA